MSVANHYTVLFSLLEALFPILVACVVFLTSAMQDNKLTIGTTFTVGTLGFIVRREVSNTDRTC